MYLTFGERLEVIVVNKLMSKTEKVCDNCIKDRKRRKGTEKGGWRKGYSLTPVGFLAYYTF